MDVEQSYQIQFLLNDKNVTDQIMGKNGLMCIGDLRLWAGQSHELFVLVEKRIESLHRVFIEVILTTHPKEPERIIQRVKINI